MSFEAFEALVAEISSSAKKGALLSHDAILREKVKLLEQEHPGVVPAPPADSRSKRLSSVEIETPKHDVEDQIVSWILEEAGDADTVRAKHARKIAAAIKAGAYCGPKPLPNTLVNANSPVSEGR